MKKKNLLILFLITFIFYIISDLTVLQKTCANYKDCSPSIIIPSMMPSISPIPSNISIEPTISLSPSITLTPTAGASATPTPVIDNSSTTTPTQNQATVTPRLFPTAPPATGRGE